MSTPEHPATPALTRKQIRELRNTGSTPVITPTPSDDEAIETPAAPVVAPPVDAALSTPPPTPVAAAPFPRPSEPAAVAPAPVPDSAVDLGVSPLTRRQARQQERIRTASVPVITPEVVAAHAAATGGTAPTFAFPVAPPPVAPFDEPTPSLFAPAPDESPVSTDSGVHALFGIPREAEPAPVPAPAPSWQQAAPVAPVPVPAFAEQTPEPEIEDRSLDSVFGASADDEAEATPAPPKAVSPLLGASLLDAGPDAGQPAAVEFPPSFDQLLTRTTGAIAIPNALIVSQAPEIAPLVAPVTATGEVIVTGTFNLPEGLGSTGHAKGTADGKEIDATLVDGELPSHSSPTPIAASSAVSTVKAPGDVIKPPVPEKGGKLMMSLAITAGVLALALVGVLILAFVTGVF
ncbi:hypothetical protein [Microbacterium trichothecenolyticum]|uniref:Uncharacterized protein n=1 Tax=Microbacterium trichothecenolyticum TaxID=69370 RepID=A0A0M2H0V7_MICTR|nr:hypothetical protein [Microbacterium trichothecenolyticum]KJL39832.1 hypothetical protein RS82_04041 [Microbacterium trichothecenolyticum]